MTIQKKEKRIKRRTAFKQRIEKTVVNTTKKKQRRPSKKLVANLQSLVDALPEIDDRKDGGAESERFKSIASKPGVQKRKARLEVMEKTIFGRHLASMADLLSFARSELEKDVQPDDYDALCEAARKVRDLCHALQLTIIVLQPFANFERWPKKALDRAKGWIRIMQAAGIDMLQVGSADSDGISSSRDEVVADLRTLADLLAAQHFRLAYENWCWSRHAPSWHDVWAIVQAVDRPNVGLCLDTFQTAGSEWGDPTTATGLRSHPDGRAGLDAAFRQSLAELSASIPAHKIFFLQISDAYKPPAPFSPDPDPRSGLRPLARWSRDYRPMPDQAGGGGSGSGGYLPVLAVTKAVLNTGFRGWFSVEVFDGGPDGTGKECDDIVAFAKHHRTLLDRLMDECVEE
ncbi:MAG: hypothetical protein M1826_006275 [Phylliscum demangeonii]|nr:MAG: hypothetical protein M1826_006275 [Phylliscum demangeonii]